MKSTPRPWSEQRILVTGSHGFLGSHLMDSLRNRGATKITAPRSQECDLRDSKAVKALLENVSFDIVFHLAASVGGIGANEKRPADFFYDNEMMGLNLIHESARADVGKLVLLGSICAYPKFTPIPFKEEDLWNGYPEETNAPYGIAKRSMVTAAEAYRQQYGLNFTAVFPTNLYGPRDDIDLQTSHVIPALIRKCLEAKSKGESHIILWGTGSPSRDFLYVDDAVEGILLAAEKGSAEGETINLGSMREVKIEALARIIAEATGFAGKLVWDSKRPDGQPRRCVSNEKAIRLLGFSPKTSLETGIQKTVEWYREQQARHPS